MRDAGCGTRNGGLGLGSRNGGEEFLFEAISALFRLEKEMVAMVGGLCTQRSVGVLERSPRADDVAGG